MGSNQSKIDLVKEWLKEFRRWAGPDRIQVKEDTGWKGGEYRFRVLIYTEAHVYSIGAVDREEGNSYLGCTVSARYPRLGEHWRRGNDLPDGKLTRDTWDRIKNDIIAYELVPPTPEHTSNTATFENLALALKGALTAAKQVKVDGCWLSPPLQQSRRVHRPPPPNTGPTSIPSVEIPEVVEGAVNYLHLVLSQVPVEMLPELLVSADSCVREAANRCMESTDKTGEE